MSEGWPNFDLLKPGDIAGNVSTETKQVVSKWLHIYTHQGTRFGDNVGQKVKLTEISVNQAPNEPERTEGKVIARITVTEDMTNASGNIHGAAVMYLVDILSTLPLSALDCATGGSGDAGVSQAIHTVFHAPTTLGDDLRIVSTSLSMGGRTMTCRCEIWDSTNHRLVASGTQVKMLPARL